jgi:hypothetical protein
MRIDNHVKKNAIKQVNAAGATNALEPSGGDRV